MSTVIVYVSRRDSAPYNILVEEDVADRFDSWLNEQNLTYGMRLANGESMDWEASMILRRDPVAYEQEMSRWVTYDTPLAYLEMPADLWFNSRHGTDAEKVAADRWIAAELDHEYDDDEAEAE